MKRFELVGGSKRSDIPIQHNIGWIMINHWASTWLKYSIRINWSPCLDLKINSIFNCSKKYSWQVHGTNKLAIFDFPLCLHPFSWHQFPVGLSGGKQHRVVSQMCEETNLNPVSCATSFLAKAPQNNSHWKTLILNHQKPSQPAWSFFLPGRTDHLEVSIPSCKYYYRKKYASACSKTIMTVINATFSWLMR